MFVSFFKVVIVKIILIYKCVYYKIVYLTSESFLIFYNLSLDTERISYKNSLICKEYSFISQHGSAIQYQNVVFTVQRWSRKWQLLSSRLFKYIHLHILYTSVVDIFALLLKNTKIKRHRSSHLCLKDVSVWREQEWESLKLNRKLHGYFTVESVLIVPVKRFK